MKNKFFKVVIPVYNAEKVLERAVESIKKQTFADYELVIVDDCSTDGSKKLIHNIKADTKIYLGKKGYNGGTRNVGVRESDKAEYILFLDDDDEFIDKDFFQKLHDLIVEKNYPEMVRLPYRKHYDDSGFEKDFSFAEEKNVADACHSKRVAPWTKALREDIFVDFPTNTLMEDVCQHIKQCDVIEKVEIYPEPVVLWHINPESTSHNNSLKWQSSAWRFVADLMDLELQHEYAKERRDYKVEMAKENLKNGVVIQ